MITATQQRDREFIRLCQRHYKTLCEEGQNPSIYRIVLDVLSKPAPSYFVDFYHASAKLSHALRQEPPSRGKTYYCSRLWRDMLRDYKELQKRHPRRSFHELVLELCVGTAGNPRFYISPRRAVEIVRRHLV